MIVPQIGDVIPRISHSRNPATRNLRKSVPATGGAAYTDLRTPRW